MKPTPRSRRALCIALALIILLGVASRLAADHLPRLLAKDLGDVLWPMLFFLIVLLLRPITSTFTAALIAITLACASEFLKRYHTPSLDAVRENPIAGFLLGRTFLWTNFIAYAIGATAAISVDRLLLQARGSHSHSGDMRAKIPKVEHGTFCVLIASTIDPPKLYADTTPEESIAIERHRNQTAARLIRQFGGKIVQTYGSPLIALWPSEIDAPDPRTLVAAIAITGALANPETLPPTDPASPTWGLTIGAACDSMLFQRSGEDFINVLGRAVTRAETLHDLAKARGVTLAIASNLARLPSPVRWMQVDEDAWCIPEPGVTSQT